MEFFQQVTYFPFLKIYTDDTPERRISRTVKI